VSTTCAGAIAELPGIFVCPPGEPAVLAQAMRRAVRESGSEHIRVMRAEVARRTPAAYWQTIRAATTMAAAPGMDAVTDRVVR
jgi:hypothetical protein